jgi:hypothetical protein
VATGLPACHEGKQWQPRALASPDHVLEMLTVDLLLPDRSSTAIWEESGRGSR